jgi:hypothetical protein
MSISYDSESLTSELLLALKSFIDNLTSELLLAFKSFIDNLSLIAPSPDAPDLLVDLLTVENELAVVCPYPNCC